MSIVARIIRRTITVSEALNEKSLRELLELFTYRPGWSFSVMEGILNISAQVVDTDDHRRNVPLIFGVGLPSFIRDDFNWTRWLFDQIMEVERHEAQEFFKINGVKVYDPHG